MYIYTNINSEKNVRKKYKHIYVYTKEIIYLHVYTNKKSIGNQLNDF